MNKITHALAATLLLGSGFAAHAQDGDLIAKGQALAKTSGLLRPGPSIFTSTKTIAAYRVKASRTPTVNVACLLSMVPPALY